MLADHIAKLAHLLPLDVLSIGVDWERPPNRRTVVDAMTASLTFHFDPSACETGSNSRKLIAPRSRPS